MSFLEAVLSFVSSGAPETSTLCSEPRTRSRTHVYPKYRKTIAHGMFLHTTNRSQNGTQIREFATLFGSIGLIGNERRRAADSTVLLFERVLSLSSG